MFCTSLIQAQRVAEAGARKMMDAGYTYQQRTPGVAHVFRVVNPEGKTYRVSLPAPMNGHQANCSCKFFDANRAFKVCKHILFVQEEEACLAEVSAKADILRREQEYEQQVAEDKEYTYCLPDPKY